MGRGARSVEEGARGGDDSALLLVSPDVQVRVCAWCSRLQARSGHWVHLSHLVLPDAPFPVTHGICPDCAAALR